MSTVFSLYIPGTSGIHRCDARIKLLLLCFLSVALFLVKTWWGISLGALVIAASILVARLPLLRFVKMSLPLLVLLVFIWICNAFTFDITQVSHASGGFAGFMAGWEPIALWGTFGFNPQGCMIGLTYAVRVFLILLATYVVSFTTAAEALTHAFSSLFSGLSRFVSVDNIALILALALRFIPMMASEATQIRQAQKARGARFEEGGLLTRVLSWRVVFVPLVVGMFRRAGNLGQAMDARCYGAKKRTSLYGKSLSFPQIIFLGFSLLCCVLFVLFL